jgi:queuine tRNA-ribosyltransferase
MRIGFDLLAQDKASRARRSRITTRHGVIEGPVFMPVGTKGAVKGVIHQHLHDMGAQIMLGNTYHLWIRPGIETLKAMGGLHKWINWTKPILTDSGGFQVFSLSALRKITDEGVTFNSHLDGSPLMLKPETSIDVQEAIGSTIMMVLDVCPALPATDKQLQEAIRVSNLWAKRCLEHRDPKAGALFAIAQGGLDVKLRLEHIETLSQMKAVDRSGEELSFDGLALGGFSVGEAPVEMYKVLKEIVPAMPVDRPRYLMGVGTPTDILMAVGEGIDMFDCVIPTRNARNGTLYTWDGMLRIKNEKWKHSELPLDPKCQCYACKNHSRSYLRHLLRLHDLTAAVLLSIHNCHFYQDLMREIRAQIEAGTFASFQEDCLKRWRENDSVLNVES